MILTCMLKKSKKQKKFNHASLQTISSGEVDTIQPVPLKRKLGLPIRNLQPLTKTSKVDIKESEEDISIGKKVV